jgi:hypothetical protein
MASLSMHEKVNFTTVSAILFFAAALMAHATPQKDLGDDSDAHPAVTIGNLKIVQRARKILDDSSNGIDPIRGIVPTTQRRLAFTAH